MPHASDDPARRFQVERVRRADVEVVVLRDLAARSEAHVVPALGDACLRFRLIRGADTWPVIAEPPTDQAFRDQATRYGIPILYPWPNRIRGGRFSFRGQAYALPVTSADGHAIHGLARSQPWEILEADADRDGAFVRAAVIVGGEGSPFPFRSRLVVEHRLSGATLTVAAVARNEGTAPMPMGFGLHPWFGVPLGSGSARADCELTVPAGGVWELQDSIPTGRVLPASGPLDLRTARRLGSAQLDDVLTGLTLEDGWFTSILRDPIARREIRVRSDRRFREHVVYAPGDRAVVCLEPYTCATDAFNLEAGGIAAGVIVLEPGAGWQGVVTIEARWD